MKAGDLVRLDTSDFRNRVGVFENPNDIYVSTSLTMGQEEVWTVLQVCDLPDRRIRADLGLRMLKLLGPNGQVGWLYSDYVMVMRS